LYTEDLSRPVRRSPKGEGGRDSVKVAAAADWEMMQKGSGIALSCSDQAGSTKWLKTGAGNAMREAPILAAPSFSPYRS
jgi:hypothetical protein